MTKAANLAALGNGPAFSAYPSSNQSLGAGTFTKIQFNTEEFDTNSNYDNATNYRFTPTVAGYYQVNLITAAGTAVGVQATIYKNGSVFQYGSFNTTSFWSTAVAIIYLNGSTDYVEGYLFAASSANSQSGANTQRFSASLVRAA